ncbi:MAG: FHA domain-containing protein, partial [Actinobacteria bacterium]|nr:FHA domain-containing protein [Actinomycetota bacterium]NIU68252.1 FHA domain-containing protein [Actinomycetota bacterium]NIW30052.1 FHA domain-containing protein [Actinomycetota bacterium]NIX22523.1 FHA domain-containing protein [Actinomycetota bacterium]
LQSTAPRSAAVLVVTSAGRLEGLTITVDRPIVAGRGADADLFIPDDFASDHHTRFEPSGTEVSVTDLG